MCYLYFFYKRFSSEIVVLCVLFSSHVLCDTDNSEQDVFDKCIVYNFDKDFDTLFSNELGLCNNLTVSPSMWTLERNYTLGLDSPSKSSSFMAPDIILSCISTITFPMKMNGVLEVHIYMESTDITDHVTVLVNQYITGEHKVYAALFISPSFPYFANGWHTLSAHIIGVDSFDGFITFLGLASKESIVLVDSFRYIPPSYDEKRCPIYGDNTSVTTTETTPEITTIYPEITTDFDITSETSLLPETQTTENLESSSYPETTPELTTVYPEITTDTDISSETSALPETQTTENLESSSYPETTPELTTLYPEITTDTVIPSEPPGWATSSIPETQTTENLESSSYPDSTPELTSIYPEITTDYDITSEIPTSSGDSKEGDSKEGESKEGDSKEVESKEGDSKEGDSKEGDSKEGDSKEGDSKEGDNKEGESKEEDSKEGDSKEGDSKEGDSKEGDSKEGDSKEGDSKEGDSKEGDSKEGDSKEGDSKEGDNKEGDSKEGDSKEGESKEGDSKENEDDSNEEIKDGKEKKTPGYTWKIVAIALASSIVSITVLSVGGYFYIRLKLPNITNIYYYNNSKPPTVVLNDLMNPNDS